MSTMPNKDNNRLQLLETKVTSAVTQSPVTKTTTTSLKTVLPKVVIRDVTVSPSAPVPVEIERMELLGSLTTEQQQRTSARVIKKLRLEPQADKRSGKRADGLSDDIPECETPNKTEDKEPLKFPTVKQRMPKALWSTDEKSLFFEALNEYGKDFDAVTAYICAKMKKKGMPDSNLKTKTQVSHFYYRTWHKLSKHVHFDENVKKVVQELYALINYGELRKKLVSVNEKTCGRLGELVASGSLVLRARGRNLRVRTPMCRALRRLNQITERACGSRVCSRAHVVLRARDCGAWARVQAGAHNPRAAVALPLRTRLHVLLAALQRRWRPRMNYKHNKTVEAGESKSVEEPQHREPEENCQESARSCADEREGEKGDLEDHLNMETDRMLLQEQRASRKVSLHVGPRPGAELHLPVVAPSEQLSSQKICFSSYLKRMGSQRGDSEAKIRQPKRQRKDSATEKETEQKKFKPDEELKLMNIEETAIDGIELMASYKNHVDMEDEEKHATEDEKEVKCEEIAEEETDVVAGEKEMSEREKDSFSEMEDKSDTDNESDHGKTEKQKEHKFQNLKVKFRIHAKKRGGSVYTLVVDNEPEEPKPEEPRAEELKAEEPPKAEEDPKPDIDLELALKQIRKGWSVHDAGDLTVGDLYLMFGSRSKLELDYWWAEPSPPLRRAAPPCGSGAGAGDSPAEEERAERAARESDDNVFSPKHSVSFSQDSNDALSGDERRGERHASPDVKASPPAPAPAAAVGGGGGSGSSTLRLVNKLINRPHPPAQPPPGTGFAQLSDRLKRLLALVGNPHVTGVTGGSGVAGVASAPGGSRCKCGHVCAHQRKQQKGQDFPPPVPSGGSVGGGGAVFRYPSPIAPRPPTQQQQQQQLSRPLDLQGLPRGNRRGAARHAAKRVVVQRLLPLLPKLPAPTNIIPVKSMTDAPPAPSKILPKPSPASSAESPYFYVLSESNGRFYFHEGDRRIPLPLSKNAFDNNNDETDEEQIQEDVQPGKVEVKQEGGSASSRPSLESWPAPAPGTDPGVAHKQEHPDIGSFLPSESLSLSPSRLLRDAEGWVEGAVQDFSLSSFLSHLEGRHHHPDLAVDPQLQSLMAESSVDYVAKFADLAAHLSAELNPLPARDTL